MGAHVFLLKSDSLCFVPFIGPLSPSVCVFNISGQVFLSIIVIEGYKSMVSSDNGELVFLVVCFIEVEKSLYLVSKEGMRLWPQAEWGFGKSECQNDAQQIEGKEEQNLASRAKL